MAETPPIQDVVDLKKDCASVIDVATEALGIPRLGQNSLVLIKKLKKDKLAVLLLDSLYNLNDLTKSTAADFHNVSQSIKSELFESNQSIVKVQEELLTSKDEQLNSQNSIICLVVLKKVPRRSK